MALGKRHPSLVIHMKNESGNNWFLLCRVSLLWIYILKRGQPLFWGGLLFFNGVWEF